MPTTVNIKCHYVPEGKICSFCNMQVDVAEKGGVVRSAKTTGAVKRSPPSRPMSYDYVSRVLGELMGDKVPKIRVRHRLCCAASNIIVTVVYFHFSLSVIFAT